MNKKINTTRNKPVKQELFNENLEYIHLKQGIRKYWKALYT